LIRHASVWLLAIFVVEFAELLGMDARPYTFSYAELKTATENFSPSNKLGEGGFGPVYKVISSSTWSPEVTSVPILQFLLHL